jgi:hypothetical protein
MLQFFMTPSKDMPDSAAFRWRQTIVVSIGCLVAVRFSMGDPLSPSGDLASVSLANFRNKKRARIATVWYNQLNKN